MIYLFAPLLAAAADPDNSARMLLDGTPVAGCGGFADLEVDLFAFDRRRALETRSSGGWSVERLPGGAVQEETCKNNSRYEFTYVWSCV